MLNEIFNDAEQRMKKSIESLHHEFNKLRTGRAHPSLLEKIVVSYYGSDTPLNQVANITLSDSRTILVTPWDKSSIRAVEKAIMTSDLGLNPATVGESSRVPLPPLTEERRKELTKVVRQLAENARIAIRNIRRDGNNQLKELLKEKEISEDGERSGQEKTQKLTDKYIAEVDKLMLAKEADLMEV